VTKKMKGLKNTFALLMEVEEESIDVQDETIY